MLSRTGLWLLYLIGHPFYQGLIFLVNAVLFLLYLLGRTVLLLYQATVACGLALFRFNRWWSRLLLHTCLRVIRRLPRRLTLPALPRLTLPAFPFRLRLRLSRIGRRRPPGRHRKRRLPSRLTSLLVVSLVTALIFIFGIYLPFLRDLPNPNSLVTRQQPLTTKILARDHTVLYKIYKDQNRTLTTLDDIPQSLQLATIAIEDKDFYVHGGFSYRGMIRALRRNIFDQKTQGGSTITQQLVKNALLSPEKTYTRKIREIILAILVELKFTKRQILEMYFNEVAYGGTAYGAEEAAQMYFNKPVSRLSLGEAALLAGLPAAPTTYSPFGTHPELAKTRQHEVLRRMREDGYITLEQAELAKAEPLKFTPKTAAFIAPHFVMYIRDLLVSQYGEAAVNQGGLEVLTSLDPQIQQLAQTAVAQEVQKLAKLRITNGAALVTKPQTGEILAMVGSHDYYDFDHDGQVNVTIRPRQPGSAIKPINYAVALGNGFTPATLIPDSPICYRLPGQKPYCPRNYDNRFHGPVTLRQALASSYNVPAVKTLSHIGVARMLDQGRLMGITTWDDPSRFGLSLTLGGGEVKMLDLGVVFGALANQGLRVNLQPLLQVTDKNGKVLRRYSCVLENTPARCPAQPVLDPAVAYQLADILSDNQARTPAFGSHSVLAIPHHQVAVKTGTTQNLRDNWTIGYTPSFLVAVWVGNNDNTPMSYVASGITGASPIWRRIVDSLLVNLPSPGFTPPLNLLKVKICSLTGQLACSGCPSQDEYFIPGTQPRSACSPESIKHLLEKKPDPPRDQILTGAATGD